MRRDKPSRASTVGHLGRFADLDQGFALQELILDDSGKPGDFRFLEVNPAFERIIGLANSQIIGKRVLELFPGLPKSWIDECGEVALSRRAGFLKDCHTIPGKCFEVWVWPNTSLQFATMYQESNEDSSLLFSVQKRLTRLELALEATGAGLWEMDVATGRTVIDDSFASLFGYSLDELEPSQAVLAELCDPHDLAQAQKILETVLSGEQGRCQIELRARCRDGSYRWFLIRGKAWGQEGGGRPKKIIGTVVDIDSSKRAEIAESEQRGRLTSLLDSIDDLVFFKDRKGYYRGCNRAAELFQGMPASQIIGKTAEDIYPPAVASAMKEEDERVISGNCTLRFEQWMPSARGGRVLIERKKSPMRDSEGRVVGVAILSRDMTARYDAEILAALRIRALEYSHGHGSLELGRLIVEELVRLTSSEDGFIASFNPSETQPSFLAALGPEAKSAFFKSEPSPLWRFDESTPLSTCREEGRLVMFNDCMGAIAANHGPFPYKSAILSPVLRLGKVVAILGVGNKGGEYDDHDTRLVSMISDQLWDVLQTKISVEALVESTRWKDVALEVTNAGVWTWFVPEGRKERDERWARIIGRSLAEIESNDEMSWEKLCHPEDLPDNREAIERHLRGDSPYYESEVRLRHKDGGWVWILDRGEVVERDPMGHPLRISGIMIDISRIKAAEAGLRESIEEKEVLLRELYHRTRNSMQLINAMLDLKTQELEPGSALRAFEDIQEKIIAMALVQEKIYQSGSLTSLDLGEYLQDLVGLIKEASQRRSWETEFRISAENIPISVDTAVPCGIIASELIGNSLSHAFAKGMKGTIGVELHTDSSDEICMEIWDDGQGVPLGFDPRCNPHMGLRTVIGIGEEQLHGAVLFGGREKGFSVSLKFKDEFYPRRI